VWATHCTHWMLLVPLWVSLLLSAPQWLPALPAPPWLQAPQNPTWWTSAPVLHGPGPPVFHGLLLFQGPCPPVLHCPSLLHDPGPPPLHGPGPPSHPQFSLYSPTLLDCCSFEFQELLLEGGIL
ncbi:hypothetical protein M9458_029550, partial [Cirrhinus mrigala]